MNPLKIASLIAFLNFCGTAMLSAQDVEEETGGENLVPPVAAEVWPFSPAKGVAPKTAMAQWRSVKPTGAPQTLPINGLDIPARDNLSMARIAGVLTAPETGFMLSKSWPPDAILARGPMKPNSGSRTRNPARGRLPRPQAIR